MIVRRAVVQVLLAIAKSLFGWLHVSAAATATPQLPASTFNYDESPSLVAATNHANVERGPTRCLADALIEPAAVRGPRGSVSRLDTATTCTDTTHQNPAHLLEALRFTAKSLARTTTTADDVEPVDGSDSGPQSAGVAAKTETSLASKAAETCLNSFTAETLVLMADGTRKTIKDVKLGDWVMAKNPVTGKQHPEQVIRLIRHSGPHTMVAVHLADGTTIDATDHHPFWSPLAALGSTRWGSSQAMWLRPLTAARSPSRALASVPRT